MRAEAVEAGKRSWSSHAAVRWRLVPLMLLEVIERDAAVVLVSHQ
jgi:hypothetical protein